MIFNKYNMYYEKILKKQNYFEQLLIKVQNTENIYSKLKLAQEALTFATEHNSGYFTSSILEKVYLDYSNTIDLENYSVNFIKNSFLHVMTEGYKIGGHTRVVERWIKYAPENQKHSVVFTKKKNDIGTTLEHNVKEKNGEIYNLEKFLNLKDKALELRKIALNYQYIVLHTHMDDPTAVVAFGSNNFNRPVFLYNHASHLFWIGKSIADIVLDIIKNDEITRKRRNISNTFFLGVPTKNIMQKKLNKFDLRKKLKISQEHKIIISSGYETKYTPILEDNFADILIKLVDKKTYCYLIGPSKNNTFWNNVYNKSNKHIIPLGYVDFENGYLEWLAMADLYLDSYPFPGGTAAIDAISVGTPVLSLKTILPQFDYLTSTNAYCETKEKFIAMSKNVLSDSSFSKNLLLEEQDSLFKYQSKESWNNNIKTLLAIAPKVHKIQDLSKEIDYKEIDDLCVLDNLHMMRNKAPKKCFYKKFGIPYIFQIIKYKRYGKKYRKIKLLNITIAKFYKK